MIVNERVEETVQWVVNNDVVFLSFVSIDASMACHLFDKG